MIASLELYESMSNISGKMVEAAQANDWDRLCSLEREVSALREEMVQRDPPAIQKTLDETTRSRKIALIHKILADDREIRSHAEPWMESVRVMLSSNARQRSVRNAYGIGG